MHVATEPNETAAGPATCGAPRIPLGLLAKLTYRCPLQCPYCSNPLDMDRAARELSTAEWQDLLRQAATLGVLQIHLSGGEPCARQDLEQILEAAIDAGLYTNLITSAVTLNRTRLDGLKERGLNHVQVSIQHVNPEKADWISGYRGGLSKKRDVCRWTVELDMALTINAVVHRHNIADLPAMIDFAVAVGAGRIEIANTQYYAWALRNRPALIPTRAQFYKSLEIVEQAKKDLKGVLQFDVVAHDHYAVRPKPCMGGWGRNLIDVTPTGDVMPCHAAKTIPGIEIDNIRSKSLREIWLNGKAFNLYRGTSWMKEPCRSCDRKEIDWGGCRCQALSFTDDAANADPACGLSEFHKSFVDVAECESAQPSPDFIYRRLGMGF